MAFSCHTTFSFFPSSLCFSLPSSHRLLPLSPFPCFAAARQDPPQKRPQPKKSPPKRNDNVAVVESRKDASERRPKKEKPSTRSLEDSSSDSIPADEPLNTGALHLPIPPAGFVLNEQGGVALMAPPSKRVATIVDHANGQPLECLIRRVFSSSDGKQCFLLCPLDTPVQILKIEGEDQVLKELTDEELEEILPTAAYELAKRRLHLVPSGFCLTMRGGFCYSEDEIMDLNTVYGEGAAETLHEGVAVASFMLKDSEFLVYTPFDPLMFVAYKDEETGELMISEDDLQQDQAVLDAIDEEKEFQAFMEEEIAVNESLKEVEE